jgi:hypothetical protein
VELTPGKYRHYKGGEYEVTGTATHSETGEKLVVYQPLYGSAGLWVRPLAMFLDTITHDGTEQLRFTRIAASPEF